MLDTTPPILTVKNKLSTMPKKLSRNAPCGCGSGRKYKHCCYGKNFDYVTDDSGTVYQKLELSPEAAACLDVLIHARETGQGMSLEWFEHQTVTAMCRAGVHPALAFAFVETGMLLAAGKEGTVTDDEVDDWEAAIDLWEREHSERGVPRRLTQADLAAIRAHGPQ